MPPSGLTRALVWASYHVGGPALNDRLRGADNRILMYHGITTNTAAQHVKNRYGYHLTIRAFEAQLSYLHRHCNVVSLADMAAGCNLSRRRTNVVLTFDDGYENCYTAVFPLLTRYRMAAVFALPTGFVRRRQPLWNDLVEHAVARSLQHTVRFDWDERESRFDLSAPGGRVAAHDWLSEQCIRGDQRRRTTLIEMAAAALGVVTRPDEVFRDKDCRPLTSAQITEMTRSGLAEWASHSVNHYLLSRLDLETARVELQQSKRDVEALTARPCSTLCLPGGSYNSEVLREALSAGYQIVLTSNRGSAVVGARVQNRIVVMHHHSIEFFADIVHGPVLRGVRAARRVWARMAVRTAVSPERS